jgi:hypothetical protein
MANIHQHCWQRQPGEGPKAFGAFVVYRNLDPKERSLKRVVWECNRSISLIGRWSSRWDWVERAAEWDDYQEMRRLEARIEAKQRLDEEDLRIIRAARIQAIKALTEMNPEQLAKNLKELRLWITQLINLERSIVGEPESVEERRQKVEIHASIEEQIKEYAPVFQELIDEGAITLGPANAGALVAPEDEEVDEGPLAFHDE